MSRRELIFGAARACAALSVCGGVPAAVLSASARADAAAPRNAPSNAPREVAFYEKLPEKMIRCTICPRKCKVGDMERGFCGNKENRGGKYFTLAYGNPCSLGNDPIEKKPLFHFLPGTNAFSLAVAGCNFDCKFCQNWQISQSRPEQTRNYELSPRDIVQLTRQQGGESIAYTYSEPVVFYEYMRDCAALGRENGLRNVMISNGYINPDPMRKLCTSLDAVKIDLKSFTEKFYKEQCVGRLKPVLDTIELLKEEKKWLEIVYLVIPDLNDERKEIKAMAKWIMSGIGPDVPVHFSRFHPEYKMMNRQPTPPAVLERCRNICLDEGLHFVYIGNVPGSPAESTYCPKCSKTVIERYGYTIVNNNLSGGRCRFCKTAIPGVWK